MKKPCVFFDRDGIVNASPGEAKYVERWSDFLLLPAFLEALKVVRVRGYEAVIVTNQRGVAIGRMTLEAVNEIHDNLMRMVRERNLRLLDIFVCVDESDASPRRKPNPGMLLEAAEKYALDLSRSWMIGDHVKDAEAGRRAGCRTTVLVGPPRPATAADHQVPDMESLVLFLEEHLPAI